MSGPSSTGGAASARDVPSRNPVLASRSTVSAGTHEIVVTDPSTRTALSSSLTVGRDVARAGGLAPAHQKLGVCRAVRRDDLWPGVVYRLPE